MVNSTKDAEVALAVANLAAAAMAANPKLTMAAAVAQARTTLLGGAASDSEIAKSVRPDKIQCLEDGTWHTMLRRYIKRKFNLTPEQYREKWGLPHDYPFVAPNYATTRSKIAKKTGFGKKK
ncbi:MAG: MucR family transcriptional regulator [Alphaproteobacteria bacterium]|nr:MucR family transcriptional regulator [Alphaproteobacteria bacterium]